MSTDEKELPSLADSAGASNWFEGDGAEQEDYELKEYDITASPNDFNISTMHSFIESGAVKIPGFQRNYVWDIKRASKLIESVVIGLPIPQIFLYEESRNRFLVIDGQQRLMSIYYFVKQRFPRKDKRIELRHIFDEHGKIPADFLQDDNYFTKFNLQLPERLPGVPNKLSRLNYTTLDQYRTTFDLRTIRNVIIKQNVPEEEDSSIYEIFNRLNSGGVNLKPQEIRSSLYHSPFYDMLHQINLEAKWRRLLGFDEPDLHMKDFEILLRGFAMLVEGEHYRPSMAKFLNGFSRKCKNCPSEQIEFLKAIFTSFLAASAGLPQRAFFGKATGKFNISMYEAVFTAVCQQAFKDQTFVTDPIEPVKLQALMDDPDFTEATQKDTASKANVTTRLNRAKQLLL